jgi:hypothetical protein
MVEDVVVTTQLVKVVLALRVEAQQLGIPTHVPPRLKEILAVQVELSLLEEVAVLVVLVFFKMQMVLKPMHLVAMVVLALTGLVVEFSMVQEVEVVEASTSQRITVLVLAVLVTTIVAVVVAQMLPHLPQIED